MLNVVVTALAAAGTRELARDVTWEEDNVAILKAVFGTACALAVVAAAVPVQAFDDPLSRQTAEPLPNDVDRQLYCAEVLAQEAHVLTGEGVRRFQMRMAASHLLGILGRDLLAKAAATIDDGSEDYVAAVAGVASEAGADWQAGTLRHSAADCLALARSVGKLGASAEVDGLVSCSQLFYMRAKELVEAGDWEHLRSQ